MQQKKLVDMLILIISKPSTYEAMLRKESYGTVTVTDKNVSVTLRKSEP